MSNSDKRIYHSKNPVKIILAVLISVILVAILLIFTVFFSFKKYIRYTDEGVRLDVPWLEETTVDSSGD